MNRLPRAGRLAALGIALAPAVAQAQAPDSVRFRGGQWGAEFVGGRFTAVGAIAFTSPRRAWVLDLRTSDGHAWVSGNGSSSTTGLSGTLDVGRRSYHRVGARLYRLTTIGASFNYSRASAS